MIERGSRCDFAGVLSRADSDALGRLLRPEACHLIQQLDTALYYPAHLCTLVLELRPAPDLLADRSARDMIIDLLRPDEARDLVSHLGFQDTTEPYGFLKAVSFTRSINRKNLLTFFDLTEPVMDVVTPELAVETIEPGYALFPHQVEALSRARRVLSTAPQRLLLHMPTGAGKTRTAMNLVSEFLRENADGLVVWLAHSEELCSQASDEFVRAWRNIGNLPISLYRFWSGYELDLSTVRSGILIAGGASQRASCAMESRGSLVWRIGPRCLCRSSI